MLGPPARLPEPVVAWVALGTSGPHGFLGNHKPPRFPIFVLSTSRFDVFLRMCFLGFLVLRAMQIMDSHLVTANLSIASMVSAISSVDTMSSKRVKAEAGMMLENNA